MLVDSRAVMREGVRAVIEQEPDLVVVAQSPTLGDTADVHLTPDLIITDIDLSDAKYDDVVRGLRGFSPRSAILVFTPIGDLAEVRAVLTSGANGYLLDSAEPADLLVGVRAVAAGGTYVQPSLGAQLARSHRSVDPTLELSAQEARVLGLLVLGHTNGDVARLCKISVRTAEAHRAQIQRKLGCNSRAELVEYARAAGIIKFGPR
jgi:two-component system response regulator NreC